MCRNAPSRMRSWTSTWAARPTPWPHWRRAPASKGCSWSAAAASTGQRKPANRLSLPRSARAKTAPCTWTACTPSPNAAPSCWGNVMRRSLGRPVTAVRLGPLYGPLERPGRTRPHTTAIHQLAVALRAGQPVRVAGPDVVRDWTYVADAADAVQRATSSAAVVAPRLQRKLWRRPSLSPGGRSVCRARAAGHVGYLRGRGGRGHAPIPGAHAAGHHATAGRYGIRSPLRSGRRR